ncbi:caprin-2 isoform X15 [Eptesicus fuscus]|uniref:caprin-2 isoform X15 n=1 Tax=Eptesicus fuscus TaxID=29078 RepID=UPI0024044C19|nr:caprin-2 isoform X15 [Eptesicus fuscus]
MEFTQPEIQPQEFLNRRYIAEVDYSSKQHEEQSWEVDYARKPNLPKCWDKLTEPAGEEKKQESFQSWEPSVKQQELARPAVSSGQRKQEMAKLRSTLQEEQKKQDVSKPKLTPSQWKQETPKPKAGYVQEEQKKQETPKPWPVQLQKEQDPKKQTAKSWTPSLQSEQDLSKSWTTPMCEEQDARQAETPKSWENNVEHPKHPLTPQSQISPKSWGAAAGSLIPNDPLLPRKFNAEPKDVPKPMHQPVGSSSPLPKDPVLRKEKLQDLMTQIQGTCNFMQESVLDFDKPSSAIPSSQSPSVTPGSPAATTEENLTSQNDFLQEPLQVFNVNAPLPPRKEQETKESPYPPGYNQSFTTASTQTPLQCQLPAIHVEQTVLSQETAASYPDGTIQVSNGSLAFYPAQTDVFPRPSQPFASSRGSVRGCTRGGRLLTNTYRSPGGYKGFDTYRGPPSVSNGNYSQLQFQAREYPGTPYSQRCLETSDPLGLLEKARKISSSVTSAEGHLVVLGQIQELTASL